MDKQEEVLEEAAEVVEAESTEAVEAEALDVAPEAKEAEPDPLDFNVIFGSGRKNATAASTILYLVGALVVVALLMYVVVSGNDLLVSVMAAVVGVYFFGRIFLHVRGLK